MTPEQKKEIREAIKSDCENNAHTSMFEYPLWDLILSYHPTRYDLIGLETYSDNIRAAKRERETQQNQSKEPVKAPPLTTKQIIQLAFFIPYYFLSLPFTWTYHKVNCKYQNWKYLKSIDDGYVHRINSKSLKRGSTRPKIHLPGKFYRGTAHEYMATLSTIPKAYRKRQTPKTDKAATEKWRSLLRLLYHNRLTRDKPMSMGIACSSQGWFVLLSFQPFNPYTMPIKQFEPLLEALFETPLQDLPALAMTNETWGIPYVISVVAKVRLEQYNP